MQKYQDLYSQVIIYASNYMLIKLNPRKNHDVHEAVVENDLLEITINNLTENIRYASPRLLKVYERYVSYDYASDGIGNNKESEKHALIYFLIDDILRASKWTRVYSRNDRRELKKFRYYFGLYASALNYFENEYVETIIQMENWISVKVKYKKFEDVLLSRDINKMRIIVSSHLNKGKKHKMFSTLLEKIE
ncbi:hypothetical protein P5G51_015580 [Virgibacillus sp. 179-BFC.A HS]|uniref:Uncharacterized protein n=1 Tax=Tigheibacillus jepli TaxID=3035914 RepID=A0ABU5CJS4_9BACI|nr:hypothetical protein [Virgibacillus sp. 179-BFC.A HS]MDY0406593.1 hypothetical protein [Virgibacillus sp. 179-BFC.A HS]